MFPNSLIKFYAEIFAARKFGMIMYYVLQIIYKTTGYILPAFLVKYLISALEAKPLGELTFHDLMPVLIGLSAWIVLYIVSDLGKAIVEIKVYPESKKLAHVKMYQYLIDKSVAFYKNHSAGYLEAQAKFIINGTWSLLFKYPTMAFAILLGIIANFGVLFKLNWVFFAIIAVCLGMRILHAASRCRGLSNAYIRGSKSASQVSGTNIDILSNFLNLKIFGSLEKEQKYIGEYFDEWVDTKKDILRRQLNFFAFPIVAEFVSLIFMLFLMVDFYLAGTMNLSEIAFVLTAFFSLRSCVLNLVWEIPDFLDTYYSADQAFKNLTKSAVAVCQIQTGDKQCKYNDIIKFKNVSFKYDEGWVLRNINLCIAKGEKVGIVGASGSGKTTLVNLLMHLYDVTGGKIEIDNVNIKEFTLKSLKRVISFVPQDSMLFNRTLADNISYGIENATRDQIIKAAKQACAHDFIINTESGYDTFVGDRGVKLSGGQRQRITIAHAMLKNSEILLLDEATSALDSETELNVQKSLNTLMKNRTTIAIAHRLSTLKQMDRIIVLDRGQIVEIGTHSELLRNQGIYYKLWEMQHSGFM